jgi:hypothetical protein
LQIIPYKTAILLDSLTGMQPSRSLPNFQIIEDLVDLIYKKWATSHL